MTWFTANQVSVNNGSTIVTVTSGEDISNIRAGDALIVGSFAPVEINRAYVDGSNNKIIELKSAWSDSNQSNAAARGFPTAGDFKEAANALRDATQLTSDQFQTLTDWGTINGTVTFTDSSGQQYTARSLAKMDADVAAVQAQAESLVGSVVLPTKADFESRHEGKYAGAGFVEWGKHHTDDTSSEYVPINQGMWPYVADQNVLLMGLSGTNVPYGVSRTNEPVIYLANTTHHLRAVSTSIPFQAKIKFPPAPDGLDKADGTGRFASLAEAITAGGDSLSASVIHRQDLCILESWDEDISEKGNVLYPYGNVQYGGSWSGITLATSHVAQGYSAFFVGDTTTIGKGFILDLTNDNHVKFLQDKDNNCYTDNGKIIQRRYRIRTIAGLEGTWRLDEVETFNSTGYGLRFQTSANKFVRPQGIKTTPPSWGLEYTDAVYYNKTTALANSPTRDKASDSHYVVQWGSSETSTSVAYNGNCWAIPIALVQRRNQGAYHPVYNLAGSAKLWNNNGANASSPWYESYAKRPSSVSDCFTEGSSAENASTSGDVAPFIAPSGVWGAIGNASTHNSQFYDAIYASDVLDLRLSAHKVNSEVTADNDARKAIGGTKRGWEATPFTKVVSGVALRYSAVFNLSTTAFSNKVFGDDLSKSYLISGGNGSDILLLKCKDDSYTSTGTSAGNSLLYAKWLVGGDNLGTASSIASQVEARLGVSADSTDGINYKTYNSLQWISCELLPYYQADPTWTDIIADPAVLAATFPDGVAGSWIPQLTGVGTKVWNLNRKSIQTTNVLNLASNNNGSSWGTSGYSSGASSQNSLNYSGNPNIEIPDTYIYLLNYKAKANFTESSNRLPMLAQPKTVVASNHNDVQHGCALAQSIFGKIATGVSSWDGLNTALKINNLKHEIGTGMLPTTIPSVFHEPLTIKNSNNSFAAKYTHFPVNVNGRLGVMWIAQEVKHDSAMDVGDEAISVDPTTTQTYVTGNYYKFTAGIWKGTVFKCVVDYSNGTVDPSAAATFHEQSNGDLMRTSSGTVHFKRWDGNGYGDNGTFTVGDNMAVITDDNENSIVRATHLQMTQYLYTEGM